MASSSSVSAADASQEVTSSMHTKLVSGARRLMLPAQALRAAAAAAEASSAAQASVCSPTVGWSLAMTPPSAQKLMRTPHNVPTTSWRMSVCPQAPGRRASMQTSPSSPGTSSAGAPTPAACWPSPAKAVPGRSLRLKWSSPAGATPVWATPRDSFFEAFVSNGLESDRTFEWSPLSDDRGSVLHVSPQQAYISASPLAATLERIALAGSS
eukprot:TRINITY_DN7883_c0_g1_i1.p1 TRINITY_DN7883_c0_g1~~TRINITY_DN7883_c0_g1_i1.p1  ORF type:complete len:211 (-),score=34.10 TRINITY_DN7883_c0_g1_i1:77-709(-)